MPKAGTRKRMDLSFGQKLKSGVGKAATHRRVYPATLREDMFVGTCDGKTVDADCIVMLWLTEDLGTQHFL